jgi:hypothetical protein
MGNRRKLRQRPWVVHQVPQRDQRVRLAAAIGQIQLVSASANLDEGQSCLLGPAVQCGR